MPQKRSVIIGDVHGCLDELQELLKKINFHSSSHQLVFVGDLINKGPYSVEVLELVLKLQASVVLGNHEAKFLSYLENPNPEKPGFEAIIDSMGSKVSFWKNWLKRLPYFYETPDFLVVHAGLAPGKHPSQTDPRILTTIRTWDGSGRNLDDPTQPDWFQFYDGKKLVVFGHWAKRGLIVKDNVIGLDTGCVYGRKLSAVVLPERQIVQVDAKENYCPLRQKNED